MLLLQGAWVQSLVGELRSHTLCGMAKKKKKSNMGMVAAVLDNTGMEHFHQHRKFCWTMLI